MLRTLQAESAALHHKTVTQFRWRIFILLMILDRKRHVERKLRVRSTPTP